MVAFMPDARAASSTMTRSPATSPCMIRLSDCSIVRIWARIASRPAGARRIRSRVSLAPGAGDAELTVRIGLAKVPHRAVIHEVGAVIGTELEIHRTVDPVNPTHEGLLERAVVGEPLELELERILEVDELDVVTLFRVAVGG